jgi:hypothetical protein|tara:strand:- start:470 stop:736 length:267 start_codon:yes stop_codon:yes gene_type:complete
MRKLKQISDALIENGNGSMHIQTLFFLIHIYENRSRTLSQMLLISKMTRDNMRRALNRLCEYEFLLKDDDVYILDQGMLKIFNEVFLT